VCAIEDCVSFPDAQPSISRHVTWALFPCRSKFYHLLQNLGLFKNIVAQFIGQLRLMNQATTKMPEIDRKIRILVIYLHMHKFN
jgi:hypothetical protein